MILFAINGQELKTQQPNNLECPHCGEKGTIKLSCFVRFVKLLSLPLFPIKKEVLNLCTHCGNKISPGDTPPGFKREVELLKYKSRIPISTLSGVIIFTTFLIISGYLLFGQNSGMVRRMNDPIKGDVYQIKKTDFSYTLWLVKEVSKDSLFFKRNLYTVNDPAYFPELMPDSNFQTVGFQIERDSLHKLREAKVIIGVQRQVGN